MKRPDTFVTLIVLIIVIVVGGYWIWSRNASMGGAAHHVYSVTANSTAVSIGADGSTVETITLKDIPSFDVNEDGPAIPEKDYMFNDSPVLDQAHSTVYFSVYNQTTAGNVNADRALFSYSISKRTLTLLQQEDTSVSFGEIYPSSDGRYLVYTEGSHGGVCYNQNGIELFDLQTKKVLADILLPDPVVGSVRFEHWIGAQSFQYIEDVEYKNTDDCEAGLQENATSIRKTYTIR